MTSEAHGYDAGLESLREALSTTIAGLTDEEVGAALGTPPTARRINARLGIAFAALRDALDEPIREGHAVRRKGPARTRRWHPGEKLERVWGALRRAWWGAQARAPGHVRPVARIDEAARYPTMKVRTMRIVERSIEFEDGARGLALALDEAVFDHSDARLGKVHVQHYRDAPAPRARAGAVGKRAEHPRTTHAVDLQRHRGHRGEHDALPHNDRRS